LDKVTVLDHQNEIVGETFLRRAKQLVLKGRAKWADNAQSSITLLADHKEETDMTNNQEYIDLTGGAPPLPPPDKPSEDLLMYIAKRNVAKKKSLIINLIAIPITFLITLIVTDGFSTRIGMFHWDFILGIFVAWGATVAYKLAMHLRDRLSSRLPKADPIKQEYERLKQHF